MDHDRCGAYYVRSLSIHNPASEDLLNIGTETLQLVPNKEWERRVNASGGPEWKVDAKGALATSGGHRVGYYFYSNQYKAKSTKPEDL